MAPADDPVEALSRSISLRPITADDETFLLRLFASTREEFSFLNPTELEALVTMQFKLRHQQYRNGYPNAEDKLIMTGEQPIGRMFIDDGEVDLTLIDIALLPEHRGKGIGRELLTELLRYAASVSKPVRLHVLKTNPARKLYGRLGFREVGEDSMYCEMIWKPISA